MIASQQKLPLDIPDNRRTAAQQAEDRVIETLRKLYPQHIIGRTTRYGEVDAIIVNIHTGQLEELIEVKCRNLSMRKIICDHDGSVMINASKLNSMQTLSEKLKLPSVLYVSTLEDGVLLRMPVTDTEGRWCFDKREVLEQSVPATIGGEKVTRRMVLMGIDGCTVLQTRGWTGTV